MLIKTCLQKRPFGRPFLDMEHPFRRRAKVHRSMVTGPGGAHRGRGSFLESPKTRALRAPVSPVLLSKKNALQVGPKTAQTGCKVCGKDFPESRRMPAHYGIEVST